MQKGGRLTRPPKKIKKTYTLYLTNPQKESPIESSAYLDFYGGFLFYGVSKDSFANYIIAVS